MKDDFLISLYNSYVNRIHDFRREQYIIILILAGFFTLVAKVTIDLKQEGKLDEMVVKIYVLVTILSGILTTLFLNHSYIMLLFSKVLRRIEETLNIPTSIRFYSENRLGRGISYLVSHFLPFALYFTIATFIFSVGIVPYWVCFFGIGLHVLILVMGYVILGYVIKKEKWHLVIH